MRSPLPPLLLGAPFAVAEARALGLRRARIDAPDLLVPHHGIRVAGPVSTIEERCAALMPALRSDHLFSHLTAAALWGLPLPRGAGSGPLHVISPSGAHPSRPGVVAHRSLGVRGRFVDILPVVDPVTCWLQCAALLPLDDVVIMGDALAGRWSPFEAARELPVERLQAAARRWGSRRGARKLREALGWIRPNVWSPKETELRLLIVRGGLPEPPELNGEVTDDGGRVLGHGDLVYRRQKKVIEYEGDQHRSDRGQWRRDVLRYESFHDAGWRVLRVTDDDFGAPRALIDRLSRHIGSEAIA
ncbi:hypothetical protein VH571_15780 [Frondihabitans sp. 4ASC-45]|uniref:hypothetical protein n=1 Tax=Frondihabitans sp. 4ASC-45 TaxID=3111636 RepID=UPI003C1D91FF